MSIAMGIPLRLMAARPQVTQDDEERQLIDRCLAGDREAFSPIVRRYGAGLFAFCARMVGRAVGEELAQETLARAYASLGTFRNDSGFKRWLYRIALNLCRDYLKSGKAKEGPCGSLEGVLEPVAAEAGPEERLRGREAVAALQRAIDKLAPKYREAFVLKHIESLSYEEMREIVEMPVPALKVRVHRAREMIKRLMEEEERGEGQ
ncbi:MAG: RNA polymerase sigma factor [Myxococcales bacterium]|jgi:RNA polymerase sigma-70 factor (ECF subfamily)